LRASSPGWHSAAAFLFSESPMRADLGQAKTGGTVPRPVAVCDRYIAV